jgi:hypothetical protein
MSQDIRNRANIQLLFTDDFSVYFMTIKAYRIIAICSCGCGDLRHVLLAIFFSIGYREYDSALMTIFN